MKVRVYLSNSTGIIGEKVLDVNSILELNHKIKVINDHAKAFIKVNDDDFKILYNEVFNVKVD